MKTKIQFLFAFVIVMMFGYQAMAQTTKVIIKTTKGDITVMLYDDTPKHRDNFIKLVEESYYDGTLFHRVIKQFMVQGGDPDSKTAQPGQMLGNGGPDYTIEAEFNTKYFHKKGALAAARTGDNVNPEKRSSGSQFYIVQGQVVTDMQLDMYQQKAGVVFSKEQRDAYCTIGGSPHLDGAYTVFGEVVEGLDVIDKIAVVAVNQANRPLEDVKIISMTIVKK